MMVDLVLLGSNLLRCCLRVSLFARNDMWEYWERRAVPAKQKKQQQRENQITKIHKQTTKQENQIINTQTNKTIKT